MEKYTGLENPSPDIESEKIHEKIWRKIIKYGAIISAATLLVSSETQQTKEGSAKEGLITESIPAIQKAKDQMVLLELSEVDLSDAEKVLKSFPEQIDELTIESVYLPERFDKLIIFIKQKHLQRGNLDIFRRMPKGICRQMLEEVNENHKEIYAGILDLKKNIGTNKVFHEGITEEVEPRLKNDLINKTDRVFSFFLYPTLEKAFTGEEININKLSNRYKYAVGAPLLLYANKEIELVAGEDSKIHEDAFEIANTVIGSRRDEITDEQEDEFKERVHKAREEFLIKKMIIRSEPVLICVFGQAHDLRDSTKKVNEKEQTKAAIITLSAK